jgi:Transposase DDE domain
MMSLWRSFSYHTEREPLTMHAVQVLQKCLSVVFTQMHLVRAAALLGAVQALLSGRRLILMDLARAWPGAERVRAPLKRLNRLLGNPHLQRERLALYAAMSQWLVRHTRPVIIIDWSELRADKRWHLLRAAIPVGGRTLTILEMIYPESMLGSPRAERPFLRQLQALLPANVRPILITDAGFRAPWFRAVAKLGWDYVGRLRHRTRIKLKPCDAWFDNRELYPRASARPRRFENVTMVESDPWRSDLVLYRRPKRGRFRLTRMGTRSYSRRSSQAERRERDPWLLVAAPALADLSAAQIVALYAKRMQIEQSFRDLKCERFGCAFKYSLTRTSQRLLILLLLHALATFVAWLMAISLERTADIQFGGITSPRPRRHYSLLRLGWEGLRRAHPPDLYSRLRYAFNTPPLSFLQQLELPT